MSSGSLFDLMHTAMETKIKAKPGTTTTLLQEVAIPCGYYMFVLEDDKRLSLLKSHNFASAEVTILTSKDSKYSSEILKSNVDFHREHPFMREIHVPSLEEDSDGASDQITPIPIKFEIVVNSFAHLKKVRLRAKLLTKANVAAQIITSESTETKRNTRRRRSVSSSSDSGSSIATPSSSFTDLPKPSGLRPTIDTLSPKMEDLELPSSEKQNVDVVEKVEKDVVVIQSNTTYTNEGIEQNNTITLEHTKTVTTETTTNADTASIASKLSISDRGDRSSDGDSLSMSTSGVDPTEENLVYFKEASLRKKIVRKEQFPIQQKGRYYLVIESAEKKGPISRRFSCHFTLSQGETILKESHTNDAKRKISEDFTVDTESATVTLELVNTNMSFGTTELQISLYMKNVPPDPAPPATHPHFRTGEVVWAVNACEVEKKHPKKLTANITASGSYYIVVEKVDKIFGGLREISVNALLSEPPTKDGEKGRRALVASVVVGGVKARPMKWKSTVFIAPAGSTIDFTVESFALVGSIVYSIRLRKVPGLTAEEERIRKMVVLFMTSFGIYHFFYLAFSLLNFIQNIGFTLHILFLSVDITLGRICFILFLTWFKQNQEVLVPALKDVMETLRKIARKIKHFRDMSDGGKFDILRIFKQMSKEGKANDLRKWEKQKLLTANE